MIGSAFTRFRVSVLLVIRQGLANVPNNRPGLMIDDVLVVAIVSSVDDPGYAVPAAVSLKPREYVVAGLDKRPSGTIGPSLKRQRRIRAHTCRHRNRKPLCYTTAFRARLVIRHCSDRRLAKLMTTLGARRGRGNYIHISIVLQMPSPLPRRCRAAAPVISTEMASRTSTEEVAMSQLWRPKP